MAYFKFQLFQNNYNMDLKLTKIEFGYLINNYSIGNANLFCKAKKEIKKLL